MNNNNNFNENEYNIPHFGTAELKHFLSLLDKKEASPTDSVIASMEKKLNMTLLKPVDNNKFELTYEGKIFHCYAKEAYQSKANFSARLLNRDKNKEHVSIFCQGGIDDGLYSGFFDELEKEETQIIWSIFCDGQDYIHQTRGCIDDQFDCGLFYDMPFYEWHNPDLYECTKLFDSFYGIYAGKKYIEQYGIPKSIEEINPRSIAAWTETYPNKFLQHPWSIPFMIREITGSSSPLSVRQNANFVDGCGSIALLPNFSVFEKENTVHVLPDYFIPASPVYFCRKKNTYNEKSLKRLEKIFVKITEPLRKSYKFSDKLKMFS